MARSIHPDFGTEYPPYEYHPWPKQVGLDENGEQLVANNQAEYDALKPSVHFPRVMGKDKSGNEVIAYIPRDLEWKKSQVVKTSVPTAGGEVVNALTGEESTDKAVNDIAVKRGPGRPPKSEAA